MSRHSALRLETLAIHAGQSPDPATGAVMTPIYQTSTFVQDGVGRHKGYEYARTGNPTRAALEACLAALEGGQFGLCFASGMAATDTLLRLVKPGEHVLAGDDVYGGTHRLFVRVLAEYGVQFDFVDLSDLDAARAALRPNTRLVWLETPTNPLMKIADLAALSEIAHAPRERALVKTWVAVDNTFASPIIQRPLELGADFVVHSTTKYLSGHSDVVGGAIVTSDEPAYERLKFLQNAVGAVPGPMDCFLTLRGLKTLPLRIERHSQNALHMAQFLTDHPAVKQVLYPGLEDHPHHAVAKKQMKLYGGMISFLPVAGADAARRIAERTKIFALAESLGGVESLIELPAPMTHASVAGSPLEIDASLVRLSVGIEHVDDLIEDLRQALG
ncbi:MAG TPA: cystathionine gamma-synthase [Anaerolineae bacterium]|nr:cystathionine gamma-synthase [Anaerolineae bacterium]